MTQEVHRTSTRVSRHDLSARQAIVAACVAMTAIVLLDLADGRVSLLYSVGFVLIVTTVPLSVDIRQLFPTGVLPPVLLVVSLLLICLFDPSAVRVGGLADDASTFARLIAATIDHVATLGIGYALTLAIIVLRIVGAPEQP